MGIAARARSHGQIIAVTGSVGKTSTKEMLRVALSASGQTACLGCLLQQSLGRAADARPHATRDSLRRLRGRHEPRGRDHAAGGLGEAPYCDRHHDCRKPSGPFQFARWHRRCQGRDLHRVAARRPCRHQPRHALFRAARRRRQGMRRDQHRLLRQASGVRMFEWSAWRCSRNAAA